MQSFRVTLFFTSCSFYDLLELLLKEANAVL
jgi:hypothetical protein